MSVPKTIIDRIFYKHSNNYWHFNGQGYFSELGRTDIVTVIKEECGSASQHPDKKEIRAALALIAEHQAVEAVFPYLPGYAVGIIPKTNILVPRALKPIEPKPGDFDLIEDVLLGLLGPKQLEYCYGWLKIADECLRTNSLMPGQVVVLAGPQKAGKTFVQEHIFTPIFGDETADPYQFLIGRSQFNAHIYRAMHLMISDQKNPKNREDVREFFRDVASNESVSLHPKNRDQRTVKTLRRMSISCNLTEKDLAIIPPLDGLEDKVMLFKCDIVKMPLPSSGPAERKARASAIRAQLPAFVDFLINHKIRADLVDERFGIKGFRYPEIEKMVRELSKEDEFLKLIEERQLNNPSWTLNDVRAGEIYRDISNTDYLRDALRKCCGSPAHAGKLLTALADRANGIVSISRTSGSTVFYTITI